MTRNDLNTYVEKANKGEADVNDVVLLLAAIFESQSTHFKSIKTSINEIGTSLNSLHNRIEMVQRQTLSPIYSKIIEDFETEDIEDIENIYDQDEASDQ